MQSVNSSIKLYCRLVRKTTKVWLLQLCLPSLIESGGIDGPRQFGALTFHTLVEKRTILNNRTGRSRHSPRHCPVSADAIASQLIRNGKYEAVDRKSSRLVSQEVSDLWRATTPDALNISDNFLQKEFTAALQHLKPGKAPEPDSICPELILHAGVTLNWLRDFILFLFAPTQNSQDLEKSACSCDPKINEAREGPKELSINISALRPLQDPRETYLRLR